MPAASLPAVLLLAALVLAGVCAGSDADEIRRNEDVSHQWGSRQRLAALGAIVFVAFWPLPLDGWQPVQVLLAFAMMCCAFGFWFDLLLNRRRGLPWHYVGTDPQTAGTDQWVRARRIPGRVYQLGKAAGALVLCGLLTWWLR
ncbi:hypothetical protein GCM10027048_27540 [Hymenobacter coalescens]